MHQALKDYERKEMMKLIKPLVATVVGLLVGYGVVWAYITWL